MAKDKKEVKIPKGMRCYKKEGGGSHRFSNRIIKSGQKFWMFPELISASFKDCFTETAADYSAVIVDEQKRPKSTQVTEATIVLDKFELVVAVDSNGNTIKKGNSNLYNVVGEDGKSLNDKPMRKGKAEELLESLSM